MGAIGHQIESIIGAENVCPWDSLDEQVRSQLSLAVTPDASIDCVAYPTTQDELSEVVKCAYQNRWTVLPCGNGSKLHWGGLAEGVQVVISTSRINRLIEHAVGDLTVTAEAGMRFADLQATLGNERQFWAIDPPYASAATLGGIVATAEAGALRQRYGGVRDGVIGISIVRADGQIAKAGGRVVKNVAGYDLMKLFTGSWGTLGIISQITLRIYPIPDASRTVVLTGAANAIAKAAQTLLASALTPTAVELVAPKTATALGIGDSVALISRFQSIEVSVEQQASQLLQVGQALDLKGNCLAGEEEATLWQHLQHQLETIALDAAITCKLGVLPQHAVAALEKLGQQIPNLEAGIIHAASGLGILRFSQQGIEPDTLIQLRTICQAQGGFLTVLEAPRSLKQTFDVWGYSGNALPVMQNLKKQFDAHSLLSPRRFVSQI